MRRFTGLFSLLLLCAYLLGFMHAADARELTYKERLAQALINYVPAQSSTEVSEKCPLNDLDPHERRAYVRAVEEKMYDPQYGPEINYQAEEYRYSIDYYCGEQERVFSELDEGQARANYFMSLEYVRKNPEQDARELQVEQEARENAQFLLRALEASFSGKSTYTCTSSDFEEIDRLTYLSQYGYREGLTIDQMDNAGARAGLYKSLCESNGKE